MVRSLGHFSLFPLVALPSVLRATGLFFQKIDSSRGCSGGRWCVAFHRMHAYEATVCLGTHAGRENKLKIAGERIAVGTFEAAARRLEEPANSR